MAELARRPAIRTEYEPEELIEAYRNADDDHGRGEVRELLRSLDDGRFYEMLDATHNVLARSDLTRRDEFVENYSDHLIRWVKAFGEIEDLNTFPEIDIE